MKIGGSSSKSNNSNRRHNDDDFQSAMDYGGSNGGNIDKLSRQLLQLKSKYLNKVPTTTQKGQENLYKKRRAVVRPMEIYSEPGVEDNVERLRCWVQGVQIEGALTVRARFSQQD
jgi:hypothetical protein